MAKKQPKRKKRNKRNGNKRKFNGKEYELTILTDTKENANMMKRIYKERGKSVRVLKATKKQEKMHDLPTRYRVYTR